MRHCAFLAFTENDHWRAGIGDPTFAGWITVAGYFVAMFFCWRAASISNKSGIRREAAFWFSFTCLLLFLGVNKQLDLQTFFTLLGKHAAQDEGWYESRRMVQAAFIGCVAMAGVGALLFFWRMARHKVRHYGLALAGAVSLSAFILIRAASFHYVDKMLGIRLSYLSVNFILEFGGIVCVAIAAFQSWRELARSSRSFEGPPSVAGKRFQG
jgi:hypothetical protein